MPGYGFVRTELEIKTLTLHVLDYIKLSVSFDELMSMVFVDGAINYFEFAEHLNGMVNTGHVEICSDTGIDRYSITAKGIRDLNAIRSSVPSYVLRKAEKATDEVKKEVIRKNLVTVKVVEDSGKFRAVASLSDGNGEIFSFSMSAASRADAKSITSSFYKHAEKIYNEFLASLFTERK
ncbi:MAG: DUF4364 family protein [Oscillospiraceae bacterium]|nr:DUF4364 family protein [Oscillospiraceae bacterium]MBQ6846426.1 DUF4364 family protein [Oscillospiraceae bacterium]MBQ7120055.1 DUF4364 family protein [Oscillospiraceae bacterium]